MSNKSILVVDDDEDIRSLLTYNIDKAGYDVDAASNGVECLEKIKKNKTISHLPLIKQSRLSVMPIDSKSWKILNKMLSLIHI